MESALSQCGHYGRFAAKIEQNCKGRRLKGVVIFSHFPAQAMAGRYNVTDCNARCNGLNRLKPLIINKCNVVTAFSNVVLKSLKRGKICLPACQIEFDVLLPWRALLYEQF
jgi:hypothetical protein